MSHLYRTVVDALYRQWRPGAVAPLQVELSPTQLRQFHAERDEGCRELGAPTPERNTILRVPIIEREGSTGELVTVDGERVPLVVH